MDLNKIENKELQKCLNRVICNFENEAYADQHHILSTKIQYYQNELLRRNMEMIDKTFKSNIESTDELILIQRKSKKQAIIWSWSNGILSFVMIVLASITIYYASNNLKTNEKWIENQEKLLISIDSSINKSNRILFQIQDTNNKKVLNLNTKQ